MTIPAFLFLLVPWVFLAFVLLPEAPRLERLVFGMAGGFAASITLGYLLAMGGVLHLYSACLIGAWICTLLVVAFTVARGGFGATLIRVRRALREATAAGPRWFLAPLGIILVLEAVPTLSNDYPLGWDPSFHAILANKILLSNTLSQDWLPFEEIELNYPQGMHVLAAVVARISGQEVHKAFMEMLLVVQVVAAALVYSLARRAYSDWRVATGALDSYGFLVRAGGFTSYFQWGGVPTALATMLFLCLILFGLSGGGTKRTVMGTVVLGALVLTHHLIALVGAAVISTYLLLDLLEALGRRRTRGIRFSELSVYCVKVAGATLICYSFFIVPYALKVVHILETSAVRYPEEPIIRLQYLPMMLGWGLLLCAIVGLIQARHEEPERGIFFFVWLSSLFVWLCLLDDVYRFFTNLYLREDLTAFTPSRFLGMTSYPLAIYSGYFLGKLPARIPDSWILVSRRHFLRRFRSRQAVGDGPVGDARVRREVILAAILSICAASALPLTRNLSRSTAISEKIVRLTNDVRKKAPANAFMIYDQSVGIADLHWLPYLTWRPAVYTPIPASEDQSYRQMKAEVFGAPIQWSRVRLWLRERKLHGYVVSLQPNGSPKVRDLGRPEQPR